MARETTVRSALTEFLTIHSIAESIGSIDEIVLSYIVGCLEEIGSQSPEDTFDVEDFAEMMEAYLPGFAKISSEEVCDWMFQLAQHIKSVQIESGSVCEQGQGDVATVGEKCDKSCKKRTQSTSSTSSAGSGRCRTRSNNSVSSDKEGNVNGDLANGTACAQEEELVNDADDQVNLLLEMFPAACAIEVTHCLCVVNGDMEKAAQLILHRQESGESITENKSLKAHRRSSKKTAVMDDQKMKDSILAKYSYVDCDEDKKEHRPELPKKFQQSKKLVRYLDNQVVSTKGERFTEIKKKEDEEAVKKTQVNLKPAKQYQSSISRPVKAEDSHKELFGVSEASTLNATSHSSSAQTGSEHPGAL